MTLYGAEKEIGAALESLASFKPAVLELSDIFDDVPPGEDPVSGEWRDLGHMARGHIPRIWRVGRQITAVHLRSAMTRWFVDIAHAETLSVLRKHASEWCPDTLAPRTSLEIDVSLMSGARRDVTTAAATWLRAQRLSDASQPSGVWYGSKHGANLGCWAVWVPLHGAREQQDVADLVGLVASADDPTPLTEDHPAVVDACRLLGLRVH